MKKINHFITAVIGFLLSSCGIIQFQCIGCYSDYDILPEKDKADVVFLSQNESISNVCTDRSKIYAVNAQQLQEYIAQYDSCLIRLWAPYCTKKSCISPLVFQDYCTENKYQPITLVWCYNPFENIRDALGAVNYPIFAVNEQYYQTKRCSEYFRTLKKELSMPEEKKSKDFTLYWVFKKGVFDRSVDVDVLPKKNRTDIKIINE
jgi:hypothetical protein